MSHQKNLNIVKLNTFLVFSESSKLLYEFMQYEMWYFMKNNAQSGQKEN